MFFIMGTKTGAVTPSVFLWLSRAARRFSPVLLRTSHRSILLPRELIWSLTFCDCFTRAQPVANLAPINLSEWSCLLMLLLRLPSPYCTLSSSRVRNPYRYPQLAALSVAFYLVCSYLEPSALPPSSIKGMTRFTCQTSVGSGSYLHYLTFLSVRDADGAPRKSNEDQPCLSCSSHLHWESAEQGQ